MTNWGPLEAFLATPEEASQASQGQTGQLGRIEDFYIRLVDCASLGLHLNFYSRSQGSIAAFPWWDHQEKTQYSGPLWEADDLEQGWNITISTHGDLVSVSTGSHITNKDTWFDVPKALYAEEWNKLIDATKRWQATQKK